MITWFVCKEFDDRLKAYLENDDAAAQLVFPCLVIVIPNGIVVLQVQDMISIFKEFEKAMLELGLIKHVTKG